MNCTEKIQDENKNMHMNTSAGSCNFYYTCHAFESKNFPIRFIWYIYIHTHTRTSLYWTICITLHSDNFMWQQAVQYSLLFQFALSHSPHILVQLIAVNNGFYSSQLIKQLEPFSFSRKTCALSNMSTVHQFCTLCKKKGSN